jgi:hypothetical protein
MKPNPDLLRPFLIAGAAIALVVGIDVSAPARAGGMPNPPVLVVNHPIDVIGNLEPSDFINNGYGNNPYKDWGNEPSVAFDPANTNDLLVSSFAAPPETGAMTPVFSSANAGTSWSSQFTITQPSPAVVIPFDWRFVFDGSGTVHGAVVGGICDSQGCSSFNIYAGSSSSPTGAGWTWSGGGAQINTSASTGHTDQPWIAVTPANPNQIYVAYDDDHNQDPVRGTLYDQRVAASSDGGASFPVDKPVDNGPVATTVNQGLRIATDGAGNVYSIFGIGKSTPTAGVSNVTYYLNRSRDGGATWDFNGNSSQGGIVITSGDSNQSSFFAGVNLLSGNITDISVDNTGSHIYVTYGAQDDTHTDRVFLQEFHPSGSTLVGSTPVVVSPAGQAAALPSLTVLADGNVVIEYETYNAATNQVTVHVADSVDHGATINTDLSRYQFTPLPLSQALGPKNLPQDREFGDYVHVASVYNTFYGTFAGRGNVNSGGVNTTGLIDPFVFTGSDTPGPDCSNECTNTFNELRSGSAASFSYVLKGDMRNLIDTALTADDPLVDAFAYVNQHFFEGNGLSTVGLSLDGNGNTVVTYTGSHPILNTYGFDYGAGPGAPHFGYEGTPGTPLVNISQYWTLAEGLTQQLANLSAACPAVTEANLHYAVFFAEVSPVSGGDGGQWTECAFPIGTNPQFLLTNTVGTPEEIFDAGILLSDTLIPLDLLNVADTPPPGQPGSPFTPLPQFDQLILQPGAAFAVNVPEPSTLLLLCMGLFGLSLALGRSVTDWSQLIDSAAARPLSALAGQYFCPDHISSTFHRRAGHAHIRAGATASRASTFCTADGDHAIRRSPAPAVKEKSADGSAAAAARNSSTYVRPVAGSGAASSPAGGSLSCR